MLQDQWLFELEQLQRTPSSSYQPSSRPSSSRSPPQNSLTLQDELRQRKQAVELVASICARIVSLDPTQDPGFRNKRMIELSNGEFVREWMDSRPRFERGRDSDSVEVARKKGEIRHWLKLHREYFELPMAKDVVTTASIFLHRFYMRHSMQDYPIHEMAPTCLYLALKVEERMQIKITAVARAAKYELKEVTKPHLQETVQWEDLIASSEEVLLEALCYDMQVDQPLACLLKGAEHLSRVEDVAGTPSQYESDTSSQAVVTDLAYTICYDAIFSPLCLLAEARLIAASSLAAARFIINGSDIETSVGEEWLDAFDLIELRATNGKGKNPPSSKSEKLARLRRRIRQTIALMKDFVEQDLMNQALEGCLDLPPAVEATSSESQSRASASETSPMQEDAEESADILQDQKSNGVAKTGSANKQPITFSGAAPDAGLSNDPAAVNGKSSGAVVDSDGTPMSVGTVAPGQELAGLMGRDVADTARELLKKS